MKHTMISAFLITTVVASACGLLVADGPEATNNARQFVRSTLGWEGARVTCQDYDSDGDGYVSCTAVSKVGEREALECTGAWSWNDGCRLATGAGRARRSE